MDPVTHGITGALLGKAYFSKRQSHVAVFAVTLGAVFPDVDIIAEGVSRDPLAIVKYHRGITHSLIALPVFALLLALLIRWLARRRNIESPPLGLLALMCGVGLASHILLDGMTSFGTRMWTPISQQRVAWDLLFIIDFAFTSIVLVPQVIAWVYAAADLCRSRALRMWSLFSAGAVVAWVVALIAGYPFHVWVLGAVWLVLAGLFFVPGIGSAWGLRVGRQSWCRAGTYVLAAYLIACGFAHHTAFGYAKEFAAAHHLEVERIGALPVPPAVLDWGAAIRTPQGLYQAQFDLRESSPPKFLYIPDSPSDQFTSEAMQLPEVRTYWNFVRFPSIFSSTQDDFHIVDFREHRFTNGGRRAPQPFSFRVVFDPSGQVIEEGFWPNGMFLQRLMLMHAPLHAPLHPPTQPAPRQDTR